MDFVYLLEIEVMCDISNRLGEYQTSMKTEPIKFSLYCAVYICLSTCLSVCNFTSHKTKSSASIDIGLASVEGSVF